MTTPSNLRQNPLDGSFSERDIVDEAQTVAELAFLPGIYGYVLEDRPTTDTNNITITEDVSGGSEWEIITSGNPIAGQVRIDFVRGIVIFNNADAGKSFLNTYKGRGTNLTIEKVQGLVTGIQNGDDANLKNLDAERITKDPWTQGRAYAENEILDKGIDVFIATVAHTSTDTGTGNEDADFLTDYNAGKWKLISRKSEASALINRFFNVWQWLFSGTSFLSTLGIGKHYTASRWSTEFFTATGDHSVRQVAGDKSLYALRLGREDAGTDTNPSPLFQDFETVNSYQYRGETVVVSARVRKGAGLTGSVKLKIITGTGTDESWTDTYTGEIVQESAAIAPGDLSPSYEIIQFTADLASNLTQIAIGLEVSGYSGAATDDYIEIDWINFELGSVASDTPPDNVDRDLLACQRYARWLHPQIGYFFGDGSNRFNCAKPSNMRTSGTTIVKNGTNAIVLQGTAAYNILTVTTDGFDFIDFNTSGTPGSKDPAIILSNTVFISSEL